jgi:hypothetical protein
MFKLADLTSFITYVLVITLVIIFTFNLVKYLEILKIL